MVATIPPILIPRPPMPDDLRYGLLQAAIGPLDLPVHARNGGLRYVTSVCGDGFGYAIACLPAQADKDFTDETGLSTILGAPFIIYSTFTCGSVGYTQEEFQQFGVQRLQAVEQSVLEQLFASGDFDVAPSLANSTPLATTVTGAGTGITAVTSELERALYCGFGGSSPYGFKGFLHVDIPVLNFMRQEHLVEWDGLRWRTAMGTIVSAGCYNNTSPAGVAPADGTFWMYATGQTVVWRTPDSQLFVSPVEGSLDRITNQQKMLVEREYVITFECTAYAKAVTLWTP